jgi:peptide/nickel transport system ATP-binding protein
MSLIQLNLEEIKVMNTPLIQTKNLKKYFKTGYGMLHAVDDLNLSINEGETLGIVGESGCGKSTLGRTILRLTEATSGEVLYRGDNILTYNATEMKKMRQKLQIIFQDPYASLNPRLSVSEIIAEPLDVNNIYSNKADRNKRIKELMDVVGLAQRLVNTYPHELDGGRRQRIGVARALALKPEFIVCDEPVSALDVSIQAQILNLMMDLQKEYGLTYMFITHDLSVVKHISTNIAVMYLGQCVEYANAKELFKNPKHPYTKALLSAIPIPDLAYRNMKRELIKGEITSAINPKPGCRFASRCSIATKDCLNEDISLKAVEENHMVKCILYK